MTTSSVGRSTLVRYTLFQIPGWILTIVVLVPLFRWSIISGWTAIGLFVALVVKDIVLYPLVRRAYEPSAGPVIDKLIGTRGVAVNTLSPSGYVRVRGELWRAETNPLDSIVPEGALVTVEATKGFTLVVQANREIASTASPTGENP